MDTTPLCPLCGHTERVHALRIRDHFLTQEEFDVVDCSRCGFRYTSPRPSAGAIGRYYKSTAYLSHGIRSRSLRTTLYKMARRWAMRKKYKLIQRWVAKGRVLDIGCGTGEFLAHLMSRGYQVEGIEPNPDARAHAIAEHSIKVYPELEYVQGNEQYQVITLWHVLEHLHDLRTAFKKMHSMLVDQGVLVIAVPNRASWDAEHYGPNWAAWDVPRHLNHFIQRDIERLLHEHGFRLVSIRPMWLDAYYICLLSEEYRGRTRVGAALSALILGTWSNFQYLLGRCPTSSSIFVAIKAKG